MKNRIYILTFLLIVFQSNAQDSSLYFNKTLSRNNVTASILGESGVFGIGYEHTLWNNKLIRVHFSGKLGLYQSGLTLPIGIVSEIGKNKNKIISGIYAGNYICPGAKYSGMKDVRKIEENPGPLQSNIRFLYAPYGAINLGYKRYFNNKHALSLCLTGIVYPGFELANDIFKARLKACYVGFGGVTYSRLLH